MPNISVLQTSLAIIKSCNNIARINLDIPADSCSIVAARGRVTAHFVPRLKFSLMVYGTNLPSRYVKPYIVPYKLICTDAIIELVLL